MSCKFEKPIKVDSLLKHQTLSLFVLITKYSQVSLNNKNNLKKSSYVSSINYVKY